MLGDFLTVGQNAFCSSMICSWVRDPEDRLEMMTAAVTADQHANIHHDKQTDGEDAAQRRQQSHNSTVRQRSLS